jgi:phosphoribosylaminoimidazolecarboxamide formyltransferase / IMP cyclohydrolase
MIAARGETREGADMALNIVEKIDDRVAVNHVLVSVFDKTGLDRLVAGLVKVNAGVKLYSTGGTFTAIRDILGAERAARNLVSVSDYTGQPEMQGGLVKTLDFKIYLGLLSETYNAAHAADIRRVGGVTFDMVVVNLYPFRETVSRADVTPEQARTNIDIGGPCMVRAAAKNFLRVTPVTCPRDYDRILDELEKSGGRIGLKTRVEMALKAFQRTAEYDAAIACYLAQREFAEVERCYTIAR